MFKHACRSWRAARRLLPAASLMVASLVPVAARGQGAGIAGRVTDSAGVALPDATVTASGAPLLFPQRTTTGHTGAYRFVGLPAGTYRVTVERDGFRGHEWRDVRVGEGSLETLDVRLEIERQEPDVAGVVLAAAGDRRTAARRFSASAWSTLTDRRLQSANLTPQMEAQGAGFGNPVRRVTEVGAEAGGPIWPGKVWLTVSADRTDTNVGVIGFYKAFCSGADGTPGAGAGQRVECLEADITRLEHVTARLQCQREPGQRFSLLWGRSETRKPARGASAYSRLEHTNRQSDLGRAQPFQLQHQGVLSDRFVFEAKYSFSDASFILDLQEPRLAAVQGAYDRYTLVHWRSGVQTEHRRPTSQVAVTGRHVPNRAGSGRLETSMGLALVVRSSRRIDRTGGGAVAVFDSRGGTPLPYQARLVRDGETSHRERQWSAFLQESYTRGPLTIDGGLRLDVQDDRADAASIPANPLLPDLLPPVRFQGADSGVVYRDLSPRLAVEWDASRDARTIVRAALAGSRAVGNDTSARLQATGPTRLVYWWDDSDGDGFVRREELDLARGFAATPSRNYDPERPSAVRTPAAVDPSLRNIATGEFSVGVERQLTKRLSVRAGYVGRWIHRVQGTYPINSDGSAVESGSFQAASWRPPSCPVGATCPTVRYYQRTDPLPAQSLLRNDGQHGRQHAVNVVLHKRQAGGSMFDVAVNWSRARWYFPEPTRDYTDPTNVAMWHATEYSMAGPRWIATLRASVRLPARLDAAAVIEARGGLPFARVVTTPNRGALGSASVLIAPYGSERYPSVRTLDCRVQRKLAFGRVAFVPSLNVFNATNANAVLRRNPTQNSQTANAITRILRPRSVRLDLRASW